MITYGVYLLMVGFIIVALFGEPTTNFDGPTFMAANKADWFGALLAVGGFFMILAGACVWLSETLV